MPKILKILVLKIDWLIRFILGERPSNKYVFNITTQDTIISAEQKLIKGYFNEQNPAVMDMLLEKYVQLRHLTGRIIKPPIRFILRKIKNSED